MKLYGGFAVVTEKYAFIYCYFQEAVVTKSLAIRNLE